MSKKEEPSKEEVVETKTEEVTEDGVGITDPNEVMKRLADADPFAEEEIGDDEETEEESEEQSEEENEETESEEAEEEPSKEEEPEETEEPSKELEESQKELELWKSRYNDSQREFQTKYQPMEKELAAIKEEREALAKERQEIASVLQSDQELLDAFVRAANNPELVEAKPALSDDQLQEAIKKTLGEETLATINELKEQKVKTRMEAIDKFEVEHPGLTDEDRVKVAQMAGSIEVVSKVDLKEALDRAYMALYPDKAFEKKGKEIEETAKINAIKNKQATMTKTVSGTSSKSQKTPTPQDLAQAKKFNMSIEDWMKYKN